MTLLSAFQTVSIGAGAMLCLMQGLCEFAKPPAVPVNVGAHLFFGFVWFIPAIGLFTVALGSL